jgi:DNA-binding response OmpR family regulator
MPENTVVTFDPVSHGPSCDILVAEDSPTQAEHIRFALEERGHTVRLARNGRQALDFVRDRPPTMVISDIIMPEMDGYALCRALKGDPSTRSIHVILLTTLSEPEDILLGLDCGADNFISKPFVPSVLLERIDYYLQNDELRRKREGGEELDIILRGKHIRVTAHRTQILDLLLSAFDMALRKSEELERTNRELKRAQAARDLQGRILRICARCKKIQDDHGEWIPIEEYLRACTPLSFTHDFCMECHDELVRPGKRT